MALQEVTVRVYHSKYNALNSYVKLYAAEGNNAFKTGDIQRR
jgi:hypothetical protein